MSHLLVSLACLLVASPVWALSITLNGSEYSWVRAVVSDGITVFAGQQILPVAIPSSDSVTFSKGASTSTSTYSISDNGFMLTADNTRAPDLDMSGGDAFARSEGAIFFSVDTDATFVIGGSYAAIDPEGHGTRLAVTLYEVAATLLPIMRSDQRSSNTPNESFVVGGHGGDSFNLFCCSLTGTLTAGREYRFDYSEEIRAQPTPAMLAAHATGSVSITFLPLPEPSTGLLLGTRVLSLAAWSARTAEERSKTRLGPAPAAEELRAT